MTSVALRDVSLVFDKKPPVLSHLDLYVRSGELLVLLGPSGSGKTSMLRIIAGLLAPSSGEVLFDGDSVTTLPPEQRGAVMVFQQHALFPFKTVAENLAFALKVRGVPRELRTEEITAALRTVHLDGFQDRWPDELSGGQAQRVALARALVVNPKVLLLDEPLAGLDPTLRSEMRDLICDVQRGSGTTTIMVTHDQVEALEVADRVAVLLSGAVRQCDSPEVVRDQPGDEEIARFLRLTK